MAVAASRRIVPGLLALPVAWAALAAGCSRSDTPTGPSVPPNLYDQGAAHFAAGRYEQAAEALGRFVRAYPSRLDARRQWAYALAALGRFDEVDQVLRTLGPPKTAEATEERSDRSGPRAPPADQQAALMLWRRAFNVYRYYYHVSSPGPSGVFRAGAICDALEAMDPSGVTLSDARQIGPLRLAELWELLRLWSLWDAVARDVDLFPDRQWVPLLVVAEPERLRDLLEHLIELEEETTGAVWLHPDDQGNWLAHPGAIGGDVLPAVDPGERRAVADELTETAGPEADLLQAWRALARWLEQNVPSPAITIVAASRPEVDAPFDRRLVLVCRLRRMRLVIERIGVSGPAEDLGMGLAEYRRLRRAKRVTARSTVEIESLARAYSAAGRDAMAFQVDAQQNVFADDRDELACLLSYVRYGAALFGEPVVMTTAPTDR